MKEVFKVSVNSIQFKGLLDDFVYRHIRFNGEKCILEINFKMIKWNSEGEKVHLKLYWK